MSDQTIAPPRAEFAIVMLLATLAGAVDACGYSLLQDLYVSFMSGNTTALGAAMARGDWPRAGLIGAILALFVAGAATGQIVAMQAGRRHQAVIASLVALLLAIPPLRPAAAVLVFTFAMGAMNAATQRAGGVSVSLTYVTGTLVRFGQGLGRALYGQPGTAFVQQAAPWLGMLAGAAIATLCLLRYGPATFDGLPVLAAIAAAAAWLALAARDRQDRRRNHPNRT